MLPRIVHVRRTQRDRVYIQWTLDQVQGPAAPTRAFTVQRANFHGDIAWRTLIENYLDSSYVDVIAQSDADRLYIMDSDNRTVYRVGVRESPSQPWTFSDAVDLNGVVATRVAFVPGLGYAGVEHQQQDQRPHTDKFFPRPDIDTSTLALRNRKVRNIYLGLTLGHGREVAILKKKTYGVRCRKCYASVVGSSVQDSCSVCYGVGWEGGYDAPVITYAKVREQPAQDSVERDGRARYMQAQIGMLDFPRMNIEDVIVELHRDKRWQVTAPPDEKFFRGVTYAQEAVCLELSRTSSAYRVPLNVQGGWDLRSYTIEGECDE